MNERNAAEPHLVVTATEPKRKPTLETARRELVWHVADILASGGVVEDEIDAATDVLEGIASWLAARSFDDIGCRDLPLHADGCKAAVVAVLSYPEWNHE